MNKLAPFALFTPFAPWLALAAAFLVAPQIFHSPAVLTMMSVMGAMIIFALSFNMLLGQTGLLSFGHAVYYGLGGYVAVHVMKALIAQKIALSLPFIPLIGGLGGLFFGLLFGYVSTKRPGIAFSMITLGIGELVASSSFIFRSFFGGEEGVTFNRTKLAPFFGHKFGPQIEIYYLVAFWCFVCVLAMYALTRTPFGRMCNALRENEERVEYIGYNPRFLRFMAFGFASFFAGLAGALSAIIFEIMNSQSLGAYESGLVLLMSFVGGVGAFFGPALGAILITFLQISLSDATSAWQLYFGLLFMLIVVYSPGGLAGWLLMHRDAARKRLLGRLAPSYVMALLPLAALVAGAILIIELGHRALQGDSESLNFFGAPLDARGVGSWALACGLTFCGLAALRYAWPRVQDAWADVNASRARAPA